MQRAGWGLTWGLPAGMHWFPAGRAAASAQHHWSPDMPALYKGDSDKPKRVWTDAKYGKV